MNKTTKDTDHKYQMIFQIITSSEIRSLSIISKSRIETTAAKYFFETDLHDFQIFYSIQNLDSLDHWKENWNSHDDLLPVKCICCWADIIYNFSEFKISLMDGFLQNYSNCPWPIHWIWFDELAIPFVILLHPSMIFLYIRY